MTPQHDQYFHYTSRPALQKIMETGWIKTTESNIGSVNPLWLPYGEHVGPDVVWLTDVAVAGEGYAQGLDIDFIRYPGAASKLDVKITVGVSDARWWPDFCRQHNIHPRWRAAMEKGRDPESWWLVQREIFVSEIVGYQYAKKIAS